MNLPLRLWAESGVVAFVLTSISLLVGHWFGWFTELNPLEVFAVATSYACTYLCVKQSRWNYPIGVVTTASYAYLFYTQGLLGSAILNLYLVPTLVIGWFFWGADKDTKPVEHIKLDWLGVYILASVLTYVGAIWLLTYFGGTMAPLDGLILLGTILAQYLLDRKKIETWMVWVAVNVLSIYVYSAAGLPLVAFQYVFFLGNTVYGWLEWNKTMKVDQQKIATV